MITMVFCVSRLLSSLKKMLITMPILLCLKYMLSELERKKSDE